MQTDATRLTILLVDDDDELRGAVKSLLTSEGYDVIERSDGAAALEYLALVADGVRRSPDLLFLDFCMPSLSGVGVLRLLRRIGRPIPAILMTGFPDPSVQTFARNAGAACVLRKPASEAEILTAVRQAASSANHRDRVGT